MEAVVDNNDADGLPERPVAAHKPEVPENGVGIVPIVKVWVAVTRRKLVMMRVRLIQFVVGNEPVAK